MTVKIRWLCGWGLTFIIKGGIFLLIELKTENAVKNKVVFYGIKNNKKYKLKKIRLNGNESKKIDILNYKKIEIYIYPKYFTTIRWFVVWFLLSFIELIGTSFGSIGTDSKMYKVFTL